MNLLFIDGEVVEAAQEVVADATAAQPAAGGGWTFWIMILAMIHIATSNTSVVCPCRLL